MQASPPGPAHRRGRGEPGGAGPGAGGRWLGGVLRPGRGAGRELAERLGGPFRGSSLSPRKPWEGRDAHHHQQQQQKQASPGSGEVSAWPFPALRAERPRRGCLRNRRAGAAAGGTRRGFRSAPVKGRGSGAATVRRQEAWVLLLS